MISYKKEVFNAVGVENVINDAINSLTLIYQLTDEEVNKISSNLDIDGLWDTVWPVWEQSMSEEFTKVYIENYESLANFGTQLADIIALFIGASLSPHKLN